MGVGTVHVLGPARGKRMYGEPWRISKNRLANVVG
jgi:hypothetical protein